MTKKIVIDQSELSWNDLKEFNKDITSITVDASVFETLTTVRNYVEEEINKLKPIYGVNTGFGRLASVQIPQEKLEELNYYYKTWFKIVKSQKAYIIDGFAGTGYVEIEGNNKLIPGSALLAVDLLKKDTNNNLNLLFTNIDRNECDTLNTIWRLVINTRDDPAQRNIPAFKPAIQSVLFKLFFNTF